MASGVASSCAASAAVASGVVSSCAASVDVGILVVRASSSDPTGETLVEGSSASGRTGSFVASALISVSSGLGSEVLASGMGVESSVDEAGMVVTLEFSWPWEESVDPGAADGTEAVVATSGMSVEAIDESVFCASGETSASGFASACSGVLRSGVLAGGGSSVLGADVAVG